MNSTDDPMAAELAAYTLLQMHDRTLVGAFVRVLEMPDGNEAVRGQAAEAIGSLLEFATPEARGFSSAEKALISNLADPSPTVRFWCCYALGNMRSQAAVEPLTRLLETDNALAPGWWYVHEEAADALATSAGRFAEDRIMVHLRVKGV